MATAVVISNMGGPDSLESVQRYLTNVFEDPAIIDIPMPRFLRKRLAGWVAKKRTRKSTEIYAKLGGKTPLTGIARRQAELLEQNLNQDQVGAFKVFSAMRYWHPFVQDVWQRIVAGGEKKLIVVSMFPFYSRATTGSLIALIEQLNKNGDFGKDDLMIIDRYGDHPAFVEAMAASIKDAVGAERLLSGEPIHLLLSAHSIPSRMIERGDPYQEEIEWSAGLLKSLLPDNVIMHLSYQSRLGPVKWLGPFTPDKIEELAGRGVKELFVYPFGHVADNSETVYEIGMLYKEHALARGIRAYHRIDALNAEARFIEALERIITEKTREWRGT